MTNIFLVRCLFLCLSVLTATLSFAEEIEPRRWAHLPINSNFLGTSYIYTKADIAFDPLLKIEDAESRIHAWAAKYIRTFTLFDKSARIGVAQAYLKGEWSGLLDNIPKKIKRSGWSDTLIRFAINLYGAPPLQGEKYLQYRSSKKSETIIGAAVSVQIPTGKYMNDRLINLGTNRFTFRPQVGIVHNYEKWSAEVTGTVAIFTDNTDFFNGQTLKQDPFYTLNSHVIYNFNRAMWGGVSFGIDFGKESTVDGIKKNDKKENLAWVISYGYSINERLSLKCAYIETKKQEATGLDSKSFLISASTYW